MHHLRSNKMTPIEKASSQMVLVMSSQIPVSSKVKYCHLNFNKIRLKLTFQRSKKIASCPRRKWSIMRSPSSSMMKTMTSMFKARWGTQLRVTSVWWSKEVITIWWIESTKETLWTWSLTKTKSTTTSQSKTFLRWSKLNCLSCNSQSPRQSSMLSCSKKRKQRQTMWTMPMLQVEFLKISGELYTVEWAKTQHYTMTKWREKSTSQRADGCQSQMKLAAGSAIQAKSRSAPLRKLSSTKMKQKTFSAKASN